MPVFSSAYLVCATPRSGSTLLCEALTATEVAGRPAEYFEALRATGLPHQPRQYFEELDDPSLGGKLPPVRVARGGGPSGEALLERARREGTTPNGVFGAKVMWGYLDEFLSRFGELPEPAVSARPRLLSDLFGDVRYVRVVRREKIRQAISLWKAIQTASWREDEAAGRPHVESAFDFTAIDHLTRQLLAQERAWQRFFAAAGVAPWTVVYEEFVAAYEPTVRAVLDFLGVEAPPDVKIELPRMARQADATSDAWFARYRDERARRAQAPARA
jgi:trehalose 2-sulfotransferase